MIWPVLTGGFLLGATGSLHCIGMCGPLSLALPVHGLSPARKILSLLLYQFGRILTYSFLGLGFGLVGRAIYLSGYQQVFSIVSGSAILVFVFLYYISRKNARFKMPVFFYRSLHHSINRILRSSKGSASFLLLGVANGFLPCGMVYIALISTLSFPEIYQGIGFMAMFGAGTLPAMMLIGYAGSMVSAGKRLELRKLVPLFISIAGILLILRGLELGIPFISPAFPATPGESVECHPG